MYLRRCIYVNGARIIYSPDLRFAGSPSLLQAKKRGKGALFFTPLSAAGEERGDKRSDVGVSKLAAMHWR